MHTHASSLYCGRFAPSPSGPLHDGSLVAAMASYLDARARQGRWLLRIEDIDAPRVVAGADQVIMQQLQSLGMHWDGEPIWQQQRLPRYQEVFDSLRQRGLVYGCACTRQEIQAASRPPAPGSHERPYPGTCRHGIAPGRSVRAWRLRVPQGVESFMDRWAGPQHQDIAHAVGDFTLKRADGLWAYQFVVVIDDADQGVTDVVRGADLLDSTARQRVLQTILGFPLPRTLHVPLALDEHGQKLSKQNHAAALDLSRPLHTLNRAWMFLGFAALDASNIADFWTQATARWAQRFRWPGTEQPGFK
ncbi:MAG TPA: tRNA glutamyl-Q(34) synthetase GluQRS [Alcaligenes sp.]|nr:tRNA glutamyl-Q(34) synthetase GluQRS [Alcaligenes sp.]HRL26583.1 tRNA glutamyl-Q(34) synthetase GluQRS [Alcaligenes sp.]